MIFQFVFRIIRGRSASYTSLMILLSGLLMWDCTSPSGKADTILIHGKIITVDEKFSIQEAVAIRKGKFLAVGDDQDILKYVGDSTEVIDLKGHAVIPGIIEGHGHPVSASQSEITEAIPDLHDISDLLGWIHQQTEKKSHGEWIIHPKFFITRLRDMRPLTLHELDSVAPDNPVFLDGSYGGMVNTKAIEVSRLTRSKDPGIFRNQKGEPTGVIRGSAFGLLAIDQRDNLSYPERLEALRHQLQLYNAIGITSVCSGGGPPEELKMFQDLYKKGALTTRIFQNIYFPSGAHDSKDVIREKVKALGYKTGDGNEWVKVGAIKAVIDGGVLTGTAFLNEAWGPRARQVYGFRDPHYRGELFLSKKELVSMITVATELGWKFTAHVTGGGGVDTLLAAYEIVNRSTPLKGRRFSIIHGNFYSGESMQKMADMGIFADMQPAWFYKDTDLLNNVLGRDRIKSFHPYRSLMEAGVAVNGGSDHMVKLDANTSINPYNPFLGMYAVVTRKTDRGTVFNPEEAITREQALRMYTINNAYASFEEDIKGSISVGKLADLVVLSDDILTCPEDGIRGITPLLTIVDGRPVVEKGMFK